MIRSYCKSLVNLLSICSYYRHEPPVFGSVSFVGQTDEYLAVCKPPSLPMHACGAYRFNSLENILRHEPLTVDQPPLHLVHRLDRVTSGLVVLAKSKAAASAISTEIRDKHTKKVTYVFSLHDSYLMLRNY